MQMARRGHARAALIEAAEQLFARHGIDGVSSREIVTLAGQRNESAVQYHFGSRDGLIQAALLERFRRIDARRAELLRASGNVDLESGEAGLRSLLEALVAPLAEETAFEGGRDYIRFAAQALQRPGLDLARFSRDSELPALGRVVRGLRTHLRRLSPAARRIRERMMLQLVIGTLRPWVDGQLGAVRQQTVVRELVAVLADVVRGPSVPARRLRATTTRSGRNPVGRGET